MAYLTENQVRARAAKATSRVQKTADRRLAEDTASPKQTFDVFLSHSSAEPEEILLGVKGMLEDHGLSVYVDKYEDPQLSPENVTPETAETLRARMRSSEALLYVHSQYSKKSRWMPWELGFFDGLKGSVGIIPVMRSEADSFRGEEYLSIYPHVDLALTEHTRKEELWINKTADTYARLDRWVKGTERIRKRP